MANAVFNSMESYFRKENFKNDNVPHSVFDLSHIRTFDTQYGALIPFYLEDCLPTDKFTISNTIRVQSLPMTTPLYNNIRVYTYYFFVPYYMLWHKFPLFMEGGRDGNYTAELPYIVISTGNSTYTYSHIKSEPNSIFDYLGFPCSGHGEIAGTNVGTTISAFPFAAYERIYRDYFMNQDDQTSTNVNEWFPEDDFDFQLSDGDNTLYYLGSTNLNINEIPYGMSYPTGWYIRFKNFRQDYFTSAWFSPQRGKSVSILKVDYNNVLAPGEEIPWWHTLFVTTGNKFTFLPETHVADEHNNKIVNAFSQLGTINDLRSEVMIQSWLENNMKAKPQYTEFLQVHFGDSYVDERLIKPAYIGGSVQSINVSQVVQTSQTTDTSAQGTLTGNASSFGDDFIGKYTCQEYGLIMGLMCIMPEVYYTTGIDRRWKKESRFDFYFPEFANLPPRGIYNYELFVTGNSSSDKAIFGYSGYGDEYRHHRSMAVGSMRNPNTQDFYSWTIKREFSATPTLNSNNFISSCSDLGVETLPTSKSTISHDVWATGKTVNPFIVQVGLNIKAVRPLPYYPDPSRVLGV